MTIPAELKEWFSLRRAAILKRVSLYDILQEQGISFDKRGREEQVSCPFHGQDANPSARIFPETDTGPAKLWCFVCRKNWDAIGVWQMVHGTDKSYHQTLRDMERRYGLPTLEAPKGLSTQKGVRAEDAYEETLQACEDRLRSVRGDFGLDMRGYLSAGSVLDRVSYRVRKGQMSKLAAIALLAKLREQIGMKVRSGTLNQVVDVGDGDAASAVDQAEL